MFDSRFHSRRDWLRYVLAGSVCGTSMSGWLPALAADAAASPARRRACILLWMSGGPSQLDTFDLKPGHANGGEFKGIDTSVPGIRISEHLPKLAASMQHMALIRSMTTKEGDHDRGSHLMHTGYSPGGPITYPSIGSLFSKELAREDAELPNFISIFPNRFLSRGSHSPGFLGPLFAPMLVGADQGVGGNYENSLRVANLKLPGNVSARQADDRLELLNQIQSPFTATRPDAPVKSHQAAYAKAVTIIRSKAVQAFELSGEPNELRDRYGRNQFGQGCLLARRLVENGVPFVEVSLNGVQNQQIFGWDTHQDNFANVKRLSEVLDPAWATLLDDLKSRGLLDTTLVVWMGEFGRTPVINTLRGRDHFPVAWTTVLAGGGIRGGQVVGKTSDDGMKVTDRPVGIADFLATICKALGIDPMKQNNSNVGRPIRIVDPEAKPIQELLA
jgi:hypothetical protein